ncbi:MAG: sulfatase-like hydrolase/transferase [Gammaproteobacteria bacterium]
MPFKKAFTDSLLLSLLVLVLQFAYKAYSLSATFSVKKDTINLGIYFDALKVSTHLQLDILHFVLSHFLIFAIFSIGILACTHGAAICFKYVKDNFIQTNRLFWLYALVAGLIINAKVYPQSDYAVYFKHIYDNPIATIFLFLIVASIIIFTAISVITLALSYKKLSATALLLIASFNLFDSQQVNTQNGQPNIVIVGIDSLRPDVLTNPDNPAPYIKKISEDNITYQNTLTPIARTFPSWVSTLTGRYPTSTNMRVNLQTITEKDIPLGLGHFFQDKGYSTVYASDEKRFSNIDESYGFNNVIGPSIGIYDFLFGNITDFPLSNLISEWKISQYLFPYTYANRAVAKLYNPDTFVELALDGIQKTSKSGNPLFIATHFCLPHWPYTWKGAESKSSNQENYLASITRADKQVEDFMLGLEKQGILENAIVVIMSDHGETFLSEEDRMPSVNFESNYTDYKHWHGNDLASINQNRVLLTFIDKTKTQNFSENLNSHDLVSLIDIAPTLASFIDTENSHSIHKSFDGISLSHQQNNTRDRSIFLETGFTVPAFNKAEISIENVIEESSIYYSISPETGRLQVLSDKQPKINSRKQRGIVTKDWLLVYKPRPLAAFEVLLVDMNSGDIFCDNLSQTQTVFTTYAKPLSNYQQKVAAKLFSDLQTFYGDEIQKSPSQILKNRNIPQPAYIQ